MSPTRKEKTAKGRVEGFYAPEAKGKNSRRSRREILSDRSQRKEQQKVA